MNRKELGAELARIRSETGLSQADFASSRLGKGQSYVSKIETGAVGADIEEVNTWAAACGYRFVCEFVREVGREDAVVLPDLAPADLDRVLRLSELLHGAPGDDRFTAALRGQLDVWIAVTSGSEPRDDGAATGPRPRRREEGSEPPVTPPAAGRRRGARSTG